MTITRDSTVLWLGIAGAVVIYLGASPSPMTWVWADWMRFTAFAIGIVSAKLATSPLPGTPKDLGTVDMSKRLPPAVVLPFLLVLTLSACVAPVSVQTPEGKRAWAAAQVVQRLGELQSAAIQAESGGSLTLPQARVVVTFTVAGAKTANAAAIGWEKAVLVAFTETKAALPQAVWQSSPLTYTLAILEGILLSLTNGMGP